MNKIINKDIICYMYLADKIQVITNAQDLLQISSCFSVSQEPLNGWNEISSLDTDLYYYYFFPHNPIQLTSGYLLDN